MDEVKNKTILPADTYTVINKTVINDSDRRLVSMLYQPIIGYAAVSLYFTLLDDLDKSELSKEKDSKNKVNETKHKQPKNKKKKSKERG